MIHSTPKVIHFAVDLDEHLVQVPPPTARSHALNAAFSYLGSEHRAEPMPPKSNRLVAHIDTALMKKIFDISERQREPDVQHHCKADDFRTGLEVAEWRALDHPPRLRGAPARLKPGSSDNAGSSYESE